VGEKKKKRRNAHQMLTTIFSPKKLPLAVKKKKGKII
jgi:hypothetical protein